MPSNIIRSRIGREQLTELRMDKLLGKLRTCLQSQIGDNDTVEACLYIKNGGLATVTLTKRLTPAVTEQEVSIHTRS